MVPRSLVGRASLDSFRRCGNRLQYSKTGFGTLASVRLSLIRSLIRQMTRTRPSRGRSSQFPPKRSAGLSRVCGLPWLGLPVRPGPARTRDGPEGPPAAAPMQVTSIARTNVRCPQLTFTAVFETDSFFAYCSRLASQSRPDARVVEVGALVVAAVTQVGPEAVAEHFSALELLRWAGHSRSWAVRLLR